MLISGEKEKLIFLISLVSSNLIVSYSEWISSDFCYIIQTSKVFVNIQKDNAGKAEDHNMNLTFIHLPPKWSWIKRRCETSKAALWNALETVLVQCFFSTGVTPQEVQWDKLKTKFIRDQTVLISLSDSHPWISKPCCQWEPLHLTPHRNKCCHGRETHPGCKTQQILPVFLPHVQSI